MHVRRYFHLAVFQRLADGICAVLSDLLYAVNHVLPHGGIQPPVITACVLHLQAVIPDFPHNLPCSCLVIHQPCAYRQYAPVNRPAVRRCNRRRVGQVLRRLRRLPGHVLRELHKPLPHGGGGLCACCERLCETRVTVCLLHSRIEHRLNVLRIQTGDGHQPLGNLAHIGSHVGHNDKAIDVGLTQPANLLDLLGNLANVEAVHLIETRLQASEHSFQRFIR